MIDLGKKEHWETKPEIVLNCENQKHEKVNESMGSAVKRACPICEYSYTVGGDRL